MSSTISSTITTGVTFGTGTYTSPLTVTSTGAVLNGAGDAIYASPLYINPTLVNFGTVSGTSGDSVDFRAGGDVGNAGLIQGTIGVAIYAGAGTVTNTGRIGGSSGVGVQISGIAGTVTNSGTISSSTGDSVDLNGGSISNTGVLTGYGGVLISASPGMVTNTGTIDATGNRVGLVFTGGGSIANTGGLIEGSGGVEFAAFVGRVTNSGTIVGRSGVGVSLSAGTVIDSGTISGFSDSVAFIGGGTGTGGNLLVLEAGYKLTGGVAGDPLSTNKLELAGSAGSPLTVNYNGLTLTNFQDVLFGSGGHDTLDVSNTGGTLPVTISGFVTNTETIDLTAIGTNGSITAQSSTQVTVAGSLGSESLKLDASDGTAFTVQSDGVSGTDLVACFARGTRILTPRGEAAVEKLKIGHTVTTFSGWARKVRWVGKRAYAGRFIAGNQGVLPIRVTAGALAEGVPKRDLYLAPEHSLYLDGVLVQAKHLVNGMTIVQEESVEAVEYFHIELESHDVIIADGAPAETYVDCDNRTMFQNAAEHARLYPGEDARPTWEFCAERLDWDAEELTRIRAALFDRAQALGHALDPDPDLHLLVDGEPVRPEAADSDNYRFIVPAGSRVVWLRSRTAVPAEIDAASQDRRRLGVAVERLVLSDAEMTLDIRHGHAGLCEGFHDDEASHRWTAGMGRIPEALLRPFAGEVTVELHLAKSGLGYRRAAPDAALAAAA